MFGDSGRSVLRLEIDFRCGVSGGWKVVCLVDQTDLPILQLRIPLRAATSRALDGATIRLCSFDELLKSAPVLL